MAAGSKEHGSITASGVVALRWLRSRGRIPVSTKVTAARIMAGREWRVFGKYHGGQEHGSRKGAQHLGGKQIYELALEAKLSHAPTSTRALSWQMSYGRVTTSIRATAAGSMAVYGMRHSSLAVDGLVALHWLQSHGSILVSTGAATARSLAGRVQWHSRSQ